ncbi:MAG: hypothetical protein ABGW69_00865 [Nanoarchaeota archaeon]
MVKLKDYLKLKKLKKSTLIVPFAIVFVLFFVPFIVYYFHLIGNIKNKKLIELKEKSQLLDKEYYQIKELVKKYGVHKEFLNSSSTNNSNQ